MKGGVFGALSLIAVLTAVPALATDPAPAAFKTVASQAYVDITRQSTISATSDGTNNTPNYVYNQSTNPNAGGSVVTTTTTAGTVGERGIANAAVSDGNGGYSNGDWLPTVNAMMGAINAHTPTALTWTSTETTAAGNYSTTFDGTTGNWPAADAGKLIDATGLATALSNKQNKIAAGNSGDVVTYSGTAGTVGSVAVYNTANAYNASTDANKLATAGFVATKQNQIGATTSTYVYDSTNNTTADGSVVTTNTLGVTGERGIATAPVYTTNNNVTTLTNSSWLPTMGAMMNQINTATATLTWTSTETTAAGNYSTTFDGQTGNWPAADADKKVDGTALAAALATKQNQIGATTSTYVYDSTNNTTADGSVVTTNTLGVTGERGIATAPVYTTNNNVTTLTNSSWLPTMGAMMNQINTATATLTWTSTETTAAGNYSTTFDGQTGNWPAADADKKVDGTALAAALATKQNKMVCTGWSSDTHTDANCWIWSIE